MRTIVAPASADRDSAGHGEWIPVLRGVPLEGTRARLHAAAELDTASTVETALAKTAATFGRVRAARGVHGSGRMHPSPSPTGRCPVTGMELAVAALVVGVASCLQGAIGFGIGLLAAPVIALLDPTLLPGSIVLLAAGLTVLGVLRDRAAVDVKDVGWAVSGQVPGTVAGALLVAALPARTLALVLAGTVLLAVLLSVCGWQPRPRPAAVAAAGAASGLLGTATSIGGPPMALVWHGSSRARMRGTMSAFFLIGALMALVALTAVGSIDRRTLLFAAVLFPAVLLGFAASGAVNARINRHIVRRVGLGASTLGAVLVLVQAL